MFQPQHYGLYFTAAHIEQAREQAARAPLAAAWARLRASQPLAPLPLALRLGLRWRCAGDDDAGRRAAALLAGGLLPAGAACDDLVTAVAAVQCFELARSHPHTAAPPWLAALAEYLVARVERQPPASYLEALWRIALGTAAAVALDDGTRFAAATDAFRSVVTHDIHPEGYIPKIVEAKDVYTLDTMLRATQALVLTAEAAAYAGDDLWAFAARGVSVMTLIPYLLYYYYYPDRWRWGAALSVAEGQALYQARAGFWELARRRGGGRDVALFLDELRPVDDPYGGGLTTLTHGADAPRQRRGLFG